MIFLSRLGVYLFGPSFPFFLLFFFFSFFFFLNLFFLFFFHFSQEKVSSFLFFVLLSNMFYCWHWYQSLTVSSVVGAPWRCGVLTTQGGIVGIGLGREILNLLACLQVCMTTELMTLTPSELEILVGVPKRVFHHCWRHSLPLRGTFPVPNSLQTCCVYFVRFLVVCGGSLLTLMTDVQASSTTCSASDWSCLTLHTNAAVFLSDGYEALI